MAASFMWRAKNALSSFSVGICLTCVSRIGAPSLAPGNSKSRLQILIRRLDLEGFCPSLSTLSCAYGRFFAHAAVAPFLRAPAGCFGRIA